MDKKRIQLISRLETLQRRVRRRLVAYGVFAVLAGGVTALLTIVVLDWLLWLPVPLRAVGATLFVAGFVASSYHWIVTPLQARLGIDELAARLEHHFGSLRDQLSSAVNFLEGGDSSSALMREAVARTEEEVSGIPLESALSMGPLARRMGFSFLGALTLLTILWLAPQWIRVGAARYLDPWGDSEWPRAVGIMPLTADQVVPLGESTTVRLRIDRGWHEGIRVVVHLLDEGGASTVLAMQPDEDGAYSTRIDSVAQNLRYWFEAGDASTANTPGLIRAIRRPEVMEALAAIEPPAYAARRPTRVEDLALGPVSGGVGGRATLVLRTSKPLDPESTVGLRSEDGDWIPLVVNPLDERQASAVIELARNMVLRAELRDQDGFANRGGGAYSLRVVPDSPPAVSVLAPHASVDVPPRGSVSLAVRIHDDFGVLRAELHSVRVSDGNAAIVPLGRDLPGLQTEHGVEIVLNHVWEIKTLSAAPGTTVSYEVVAFDNQPGSDGAGQVGRSSPMTLRIITEAEFELRVREDLVTLERRLRQAVVDEQTIYDRTSALLNPEDPPPVLAEGDRQGAVSMSGGQSRLARQVREIAGRLDELRAGVEGNRVGGEETAANLLALSRGLRDTAAGPMNVAVEALLSIRDQAEAAAQQHAVGDALQAEQEAVVRLQQALRSIAQWGAFQGVVARTRDLLDRQMKLTTETATLERDTLGKTSDSLSEDEAASLRRLSRQQQQVASDAAQHLEEMARTRDVTRAKDPAAADAVDDAVRAARARELLKHLSLAGEAIESNRTAAAAIDQRAAAEAIRAMISALRDRDARSLEELRKRLQAAEEQVARLIEDQAVLRAATTEAASLTSVEPACESLAAQQRTLARNASLVADDMAESERSESASRVVRQASRPMEQAGEALAGHKADSAVPGQDEAIGLLERARAELEEAANRAAEEQLRHSLAQIHDELEAMLAGQLAVNEAAVKLRQAVVQKGRLGRGEARTASKLAREQADVRERVSAVLPALEKVPVYEWALERVSPWMDQSRDALDARRIDEALLALQERIARELKKLIVAIVETQSLPMESEFAEAEQTGGEGEQASGETKPVPALAELLVLKTMQIDILERTQALGGSFDADNATEEQLQRLAELGEDQVEVRRLTERVTERARGH